MANSGFLRKETAYIASILAKLAPTNLLSLFEAYLLKVSDYGKKFILTSHGQSQSISKGSDYGATQV